MQFVLFGNVWGMVWVRSSGRGVDELDQAFELGQRRTAMLMNGREDFKARAGDSW